MEQGFPCLSLFCLCPEHPDFQEHSQASPWSPKDSFLSQDTDKALSDLLSGSHASSDGNSYITNLATVTWLSVHASLFIQSIKIPKVEN